MVLGTTKITQGGSGPSGIVAGDWTQILVSIDCADAGDDLHKATELLIKENMHRRNRLFISLTINGVKTGTTQ